MCCVSAGNWVLEHKSIVMCRKIVDAGKRGPCGAHARSRCWCGKSRLQSQVKGSAAVLCFCFLRPCLNGVRWMLVGEYECGRSKCLS